jgi:hypothetical protein
MKVSTNNLVPNKTVRACEFTLCKKQKERRNSAWSSDFFGLMPIVRKQPLRRDFTVAGYCGLCCVLVVSFLASGFDHCFGFVHLLQLVISVLFDMIA